MNASRVGIFGLCLGLVLCLAPSAQAGFLQIGVTGPDGSDADWDWDVEDAHLIVHEYYPDFSTGTYPITVSGLTDSDPVLTITKMVTNTTSFAWSAYHLDLDSGDTDTFVGVPTSNLMTLAFQDNFNVDFGPPVFVQPGDTVSFTFQVNVPDTGGFSFTLTQSPELVPEPASLGLLVLAAGCVAAFRRRRSS